MRHPNLGSPKLGIIIVQVGNSRLGCAGPKSILPVLVVDSGLATSCARNDGICIEADRTTMRLRISHATAYRYEPPASGVIQILRMTPGSHDGQYVADWQIDLS